MIPHSQPFIDPTDASAIESRLQTGMSDAAEVILPTYVCDSVLRVVTAVGASPVFCDVGQDWNITATEVARCVTPRTGAIIVVHTFGIAADVAQLQEFGVPVIQDCGQSLGLQLPNGEHVGHQGYASFFSFHATKSLTTGEGGAVATSDPQLLSNLKRLRDADVHRDYQLSDSQFPNAVRCYRTTCSIPRYPSLSDSGVDRTCAAAAFLGLMMLKIDRGQQCGYT